MRRLSLWKRTGKAGLAALLLAACAPAAPAASPAPEVAENRVVRKPATVALAGSVRDQAGDPVPAGTEVRLRTPNGSPLAPDATATTDADGKWAIEKAPVGRHVVRADVGATRYATFVQATAAQPSVRLTLGSTLIAEAALAGAMTQIPAFDQGAFDRTVFDVDRAYKGRPAPDPADPRAALAAVKADVPGLAAIADALGFSLP